MCKGRSTKTKPLTLGKTRMWVGLYAVLSSRGGGNSPHFIIMEEINVLCGKCMRKLRPKTTEDPYFERCPECVAKYGER